MEPPAPQFTILHPRCVFEIKSFTIYASLGKYARRQGKVQVHTLFVEEKRTVYLDISENAKGI